MAEKVGEIETVAQPVTVEEARGQAVLNEDKVAAAVLLEKGVAVRQDCVEERVLLTEAQTVASLKESEGVALLLESGAL